MVEDGTADVEVAREVAPPNLNGLAAGAEAAGAKLKPLTAVADDRVLELVVPAGATDRVEVVVIENPVDLNGDCSDVIPERLPGKLLPLVVVATGSSGPVKASVRIVALPVFKMGSATDLVVLEELSCLFEKMSAFSRGREEVEEVLAASVDCTEEAVGPEKPLVVRPAARLPRRPESFPAIVVVAIAVVVDAEDDARLARNEPELS